MSSEKKRILLADDDPDIRLSIVDRLESFGFHVTAVANGQEAVEEIARRAYDLVIMDVMMPIADGFEALHMLRQMRPKTPVLVITSSQEKAVASLTEGAQGCLTKPIDQERLKAEVERLMARPMEDQR